MRVMILSHGHPALSAGGAERAAYALFEHLKQDPEIHEATFVARAAPESIGHSAALGAFRGRRDEVLAALPSFDALTYTSLDYNQLRHIVHALLERFEPDIVHVHHFVHVGIDIFEILKQCDVKICFTLHEYLPICHNYGQMLKTNGRLCYAASPAECAGCFPGTTAGWFFLRERIIKAFLENVDHFISPSSFLADRYVAWGLHPEALSVLENPLAPGLLAEAGRAAVPAGKRRRRRIGFFGQINPFKGVDVLLRAVAALPEDARSALEVTLYGANLEFQSGEFRAEIERLVGAVRDVVTLYGPYDNGSVIRLMQDNDWIVVPSVWWENSPVVIQEALLAGRPVLASRIGGMAEKVEAGTGLSFEAGSVASLASALEAIAEGSAEVGVSASSAARRHRGFARAITDVYRALMPGPR